jgi:hypothetical protein
LGKRNSRLSLVDIYLDFADVINRGHSFSIKDVTHIHLERVFALTLETARLIRTWYRIQLLLKGVLQKPN